MLTMHSFFPRAASLSLYYSTIVHTLQHTSGKRANWIDSFQNMIHRHTVHASTSSRYGLNGYCDLSQVLILTKFWSGTLIRWTQKFSKSHLTQLDIHLQENIIYERQPCPEDHSMSCYYNRVEYYQQSTGKSQISVLTKLIIQKNPLTNSNAAKLSNPSHWG